MKTYGAVKKAELHIVSWASDLNQFIPGYTRIVVVTQLRSGNWRIGREGEGGAIFNSSGVRVWPTARESVKRRFGYFPPKIKFLEEC